jgi:TRAP-type mannitol/chloroaromatic compound transport system substrate-binding protein
MKLQRRQFLTSLGAGAGAISIAKPAIAQSMPNMKWRLADSRPKSLEGRRDRAGP